MGCDYSPHNKNITMNNNLWIFDDHNLCDNETWKVLKLHPFGENQCEMYPYENECEKLADESRMTLKKMQVDPYVRNRHSLYFLNALYDVDVYELWNELWNDGYQYEPLLIQEWPSRNDIYFDWTPYQKVWNETSHSLEYLEGNLLLTWYLETYEDSKCIYCDEEEKKQYGSVEVWRIYPDDWNPYWWFILWYTEGNLILTDFPHKRFDRIYTNDGYKETDLRKIANDGKIHTFHVILDNGWRQERGWNGSMIREWWLIE